MQLQVWTPCYDDLRMLRGAIESTAEWADHLTHYVVDGRYASFPGGTDLTPGADARCSKYDHVEYTHPPSLPIGNSDVREEFRSPQHEQAKWVNYDLLDADKWALEMDTDERLERLDLDALADLDQEHKYTPEVTTADGEQLYPAIRLYVPRYWTFWIDDVMFWREFYPRETTVHDLVYAHAKSSHRNTRYGGQTDAIAIRNLGSERPKEYQNRRADQLETMGAGLAAKAVRDGKQPSTVDDLTKEYDR